MWLHRLRRDASHIRRREGERYREQLQALAAELGVSISSSSTTLCECEELWSTWARRHLHHTLPAGGAAVSGPRDCSRSGKSDHLNALLAAKSYSREAGVMFRLPIDAIAEAVTALLRTMQSATPCASAPILLARTTWPTPPGLYGQFSARSLRAFAPAESRATGRHNRGNL